MEKYRVLIVDDNKSFIDLLKDVCNPDYDVFTSETGEDGYKLIESCKPDLVLLDINMPGMSGIDFIKKMSSSDETKKIPIIVLTASDYNSATETLLRGEHSVKAFMSKLSPVDAVSEKITEVLKDKSQ